MEKISKKKLIEILKDSQNGNYEDAHSSADSALLDYINDKEITEAFNSVERWYT